jgi:hypothetical protein
MAIGADGIELNVADAATATDRIAAVGGEWDAMWAPSKAFIDQLISAAPWGHDKDGLDFQNKALPALEAFVKGGDLVGPAYRKMGADARTALTQTFPELDQNGSQQLRQV